MIDKTGFGLVLPFTGKTILAKHGLPPLAGLKDALADAELALVNQKATGVDTPGWWAGFADLYDPLKPFFANLTQVTALMDPPDVVVVDDLLAGWDTVGRMGVIEGQQKDLLGQKAEALQLRAASMLAAVSIHLLRGNAVTAYKAYADFKRVMENYAQAA